MAVNLAPPGRLMPVGGVSLGTTAAGIKKSKRDDLAVISLCEGAEVAGIFTQNRYPAPPVQICRRHLEANRGIRGLAINAGIANAGTAGQGLKDARESCRRLAALIHCGESQILPFSTGVIMQRLPMAKYIAGLKKCAANLHPDNWAAAAKAIMTTDTVAKGISRQIHIGGKAITVTGIAKGSGMIHPNMATMLAFIATDAAVSRTLLQRWLREICADTFNAISVDGDTSTNDSAIFIATGKIKTDAANRKKLFNAILEVCGHLAESIVRDGEGATKLITIRASGAPNFSVARAAAEAIATSPLVKTALFAGDANVGRLLMALGNIRPQFDSARVNLSLKSGKKIAPVIRGGGLHPQYSEAKSSRILANAEVEIHIEMNQGMHRAILKTCDLSPRYIEINAAYRS